jgi:hypothetical protein
MCKRQNGMHRPGWLVLAFTLAATVVPMAARATEPGPFTLSHARLAADTGIQPAETLVTREEVMADGGDEDKSLPISLSVSYYLLSDYIFRGINFSEYEGEGREKPNHQLTTSIAVDLGDFGTLGFDTFFEWYAAQKKINPHGGSQNLQEYDFVIWWQYGIEPIATDLTLGYTFYIFPNLGKFYRREGESGRDRTTEWWFQLDHNDAWMWTWLFPDNDEGILNPSFLFAQDVGIAGGAVWMEFGMSHPFVIPGIEDLTITPSHVLAVDGGYLRRIQGIKPRGGLRMAYQQLGLDVTYDLTRLLQLPSWAGTVSISGLLYYNNALGTARGDGSINDEFWGGMAVNWAWGG